MSVKFVGSTFLEYGSSGGALFQCLHRKRLAVAPHVGFSPCHRGFGRRAGFRIWDFDSLEGEEERFLALCCACGGVGVRDIYRPHTLQRMGELGRLVRDFQFVECLGGRHNLGVLAEVAVACRVREVPRVFRLDITIAANAVLISLAGLYIVLNRPVADEIPVAVKPGA